MAIGYDCYRSLWNKLEKMYWKYQIKIYYVYFWTSFFIKNEAKVTWLGPDFGALLSRWLSYCIGCIYLMNISMETIHSFSRYRSLWNKLEKMYWKYQIKIYYVHFRPLYRPCLPSYYARRYCHLITLVTSVYRKTNVFLTTVGTAMPPGVKMVSIDTIMAYSHRVQCLQWKCKIACVFFYFIWCLMT
jgi:hypothetical protein